MANFFADFFDPFGIFHKTSAKEQEDDRYDQQFGLQKEAFEYQKQYDQWSQGMAEKEYQLASSPISSVVNDASKVGVSPMTALGQSTGSVSVPSSNVQNPSAVGFQSTLPSMISSTTQLADTAIKARVERDIAEEQANLKRQEMLLIDRHNRKSEDIQDAENVVHSRLADVQSKLADIENGRLKNDTRRVELAQKEFLHQRTKDIKSYFLDKAKMGLSEKEFAQRVSEFNQTFDRLSSEFEKEMQSASADRRTSILNNFITAVGRIGSAFAYGFSKSMGM